MSCLNLRLPPAKKAWKSFTSRLQSRLHKLHKSKAIKKPKTKKPNRFHQNRRCLFKKKAGAVYIDKLFKEPVSAAELLAQCPVNAKKVKLLDQEKDEEDRATPAGTSNNINGGAADDMWESLALASPQMNGIDQRAEEFIQSFRAELELQEIMARRLL